MHVNWPSKPFFFYLALVFALANAVLASCDDSTAIPQAKNSITGSADGTPFTATNVRMVRDTTDVFTIYGRIQSDVRFNISFFNETVEDHPVQTGGAFLEFVDQLDSLLDVEPPIEDSLILDSLAQGLLELLQSDSDPLAPDLSFAFYTVGNVIYYSESGTFTLTEFDPELRRISGTLNMVLINFNRGRKEWTAVLEDVEYFE